VVTLKGNVRPLEVIEALEGQNIESRPVWKPLHLQPYFKAYDFIGSNVSESLFEQGICLPSDTKMSDADLEEVVVTIKNAVNGHAAV
jgi:dTDP-4-amino-4,6-dideoxygalactose transaminase